MAGSPVSHPSFFRSYDNTPQVQERLVFLYIVLDDWLDALMLAFHLSKVASVLAFAEGRSSDPEHTG